jgi:hypothetical protein
VWVVTGDEASNRPGRHPTQEPREPERRIELLTYALRGRFAPALF